MTGIGIALVLALVLAKAGPAAAAEPYPSRNVRLIVPYPPGGNVDSAARASSPTNCRRSSASPSSSRTRPAPAA
jgi:tripartite-type tricarboxylate transporter receptor subunit TctC